MDLELMYTINQTALLSNFTIIINITIITKQPQSCHSKNVVCLFQHLKLPEISITLGRSFEFGEDLPSLYRPACTDPILYGTVRRPNQTNIGQGSIFLEQSRRRANYDNSHGAFRLFTVLGLILGLFDRPHWLSPP